MKIYKLKHLGFCKHKIIYVYAKNADEAVEIANRSVFGAIFDESDIIEVADEPCVIYCNEE